MKICNKLEFSNNKWLTNIYNRQICYKNFGYKSHLVDLVHYLNDKNIKLTTSGGDKVVKTNL